MTLRQRLNRLREQAGNPAADHATAEATKHPTLRERLARVQTQQRLTTQRARPRMDSAALAEMLGAAHAARGLIECKQHVSLDAAYGDHCLRALQGTLQALPEGTDLDPASAVFLDTETTGLAGGTGTVVFLVGTGTIEYDDFVLRQWLLTGFAGEAALLERLAALLAHNESVVTYNGKSFDVPLLKTRARLAGLDLGIDALGHLDLLHPTRRAFRRHWPNCRLATAERELLNRERQNDLPGAEAPMAWLDYLQCGDPTRLTDVLRHNADDILALAALWPALDAVYDTA